MFFVKKSPNYIIRHNHKHPKHSNSSHFKRPSIGSPYFYLIYYNLIHSNPPPHSKQQGEVWQNSGMYFPIGFSLYMLKRHYAHGNFNGFNQKFQATLFINSILN
jgi:hypothetical protein